MDAPEETIVEADLTDPVHAAALPGSLFRLIRPRPAVYNRPAIRCRGWRRSTPSAQGSERRPGPVTAFNSRLETDRQWMATGTSSFGVHLLIVVDKNRKKVKAS
jgi:hypothetical protein